MCQENWKESKIIATERKQISQQHFGKSYKIFNRKYLLYQKNIDINIRWRMHIIDKMSQIAHKKKIGQKRFLLTKIFIKYQILGKKTWLNQTKCHPKILCMKKNTFYTNIIHVVHSGKVVCNDRFVFCFFHPSLLSVSLRGSLLI